MRESRRERRYKGRAIRKARREAVAVVDAIDWAELGSAVDALFAFIGDAAEVIARAVADAAQAVVDRFGQVASLYCRAVEEQRRAHRDWMLTHRALESGRR